LAPVRLPEGGEPLAFEEESLEDGSEFLRRSVITMTVTPSASR
jgi:hypothetical protein